ncbi:hypothetical protein FLA_3172 [Filimonas lacunae]|nr:hypothetical protein FLA_3172 [Filimonas lacunae]
MIQTPAFYKEGVFLPPAPAASPLYPSALTKQLPFIHPSYIFFTVTHLKRDYETSCIIMRRAVIRLF